MLAIADSAQQGLFDASWCGNVVPRDSFYGLLAEHGERIVCDGDFADCYAEGRGRPSIPPSTLAKILLLAYRCGLSDRQAMEAVRFDLRWKVALCLPLDHEGFHPTSLVKFRARLLLHGKERVVFERSLNPSAPTALAFTPDGRLLIASQTGQLWVYAGEALVAHPALDLASVLCSNNTRGLLGVAADPSFASNRYIYLFYTLRSTASVRTTRRGAP